MADQSKGDRADVASACAEALASHKERLRGLRYGRITIDVYSGEVQHIAVTENFQVGRTTSRAKPPTSPFGDD